MVVRGGIGRRVVAVGRPHFPGIVFVGYPDHFPALVDAVRYVILVGTIFSWVEAV